MGLLEQLFDTGDSGIEDIGDVLRPFVFVGPAFGDFENPGFGRGRADLRWFALWVEAGFWRSVATEIISRTTRVRARCRHRR